MRIRCLALVAVFAASSFAQNFRGDIAGTVVDSSGAALVDAIVKLDNPATGYSRSMSTTGNGAFLFAELQTGIYQITVTAPGFQVTKIGGLEVSVAKTTNVPVQLSVAQQQSVIEVSGTAVSLETTSTALVAVVDDKAVRDMPMNGRDFKQMIKLAPGVTPSGTSINGMRTNGANYQIDGADNNDAYSNAVAVNQGGVSGIAGALVPIEALDQFSVETNASADMGRNAGAAIQMVIKSGTNSLHGDLFFFDRNEALAALSPLQNPGSPKQEIRNNQFGFATGGPIIKNKTFFFLTGEVQLAVAGLSILDTSPSAAWVDAGTAVLQKYGVALNPVSANLINIWPANSRTGPATANNYLANSLNTYNSYNGIIKVDHRFNDKHSLAIRYLGGTGTQAADVGSNFHDFFQVAPMHVHNFSVVENAILSPRLVNQLTLGTNYFLQTFDDVNIGFDPLAMGLVTGGLSGAPKITINGFDYVGATPPLGRTDTTGHATDNLSFTSGRHQWKFGGEFRVAVVDVAYFSNSRSTFTFDGTRGPWATDPTVSSTLRSMADFLAGEPSNSNGATIIRGDPQRVYHVNSGDWWVHDTFQISPLLNINYGVRYSYQGAPYTTNAPIYNFTPANGFTNSDLYSPSHRDFAPRFGFAYTPKRGGKWVIRGGWGIFYDVPTVSEFTAGGGTGNGGASGAAYNPAGANPVFSVSAKNVIFQPGVPVFGTATATPPFGAYSVNPNFTMPHIQNFNLNIQRQLTSSTLLQVGYVGSEGRKLAAVLDINQLINGVRPYAALYPTLGAINQLAAIADSSYNSLQVALHQRVWRGLTANVNYTYGHSLDDASSVGTPTNSYNLKNDWGSSTFDVRHAMTSFVSYDLPHWTKFASRLTNGWQFNALLTFTTGSPMSISAGTNVSGTSEGKDRVDLVGDPYANIPVLTNTRAVQYFNPAAFAKPAAGTFGNLGRDVLYGPGFGSVDFSIFKKIPITERIAGQFRVEIFNLFNRTNWANPTTTLTSATFGQLTQTKNGSSAPGLGFGEPRNVQLAFKIAF